MSEFRRRLMMQRMLSGGGGILPEEATDGVYIQDVRGFLFTVEEWTKPNSQANGVAVIDARHPQGGFIIAKDDDDVLKVWGTYNKLLSNILTTDDYNIAKTDYLGKQNTEQIIAQDRPTCEAAIYCNSFTFPNGNKGYLGAAGEWGIAYKNKQNIDICLSKIMGKAFYTDYYWTSTQYNSISAYMVLWDYDYIGGEGKADKRYVRPFTTLQ